jgi:hypothetical protein
VKFHFSRKGLKEKTNDTFDRVKLERTSPCLNSSNALHILLCLSAPIPKHDLSASNMAESFSHIVDDFSACH